MQYARLYVKLGCDRRLRRGFWSICLEENRQKGYLILEVLLPIFLLRVFGVDGSSQG